MTDSDKRDICTLYNGEEIMTDRDKRRRDNDR